MMYAVLNNLIISVLGAVIFELIKYIIDVFSTTVKSPYSGEWVNEIYVEGDYGKVVKRDRLKLKYNKRKHTVTGKIQRYEPTAQNYRKWKCSGVIDGDKLILSFWANEGTVKSNGCIYTRHEKDNRYLGYYLEEHNGIIDKTPIALMKVKK